MGSSDSSSSGSGDAVAAKKAKPAVPKASGPRFSVAHSDSSDEANDKNAGISTASAADSFNKKQWELMERLKVDYRRQSDKKALACKAQASDYKAAIRAE